MMDSGVALSRRRCARGSSDTTFGAKGMISAREKVENDKGSLVLKFGV